MAFCSVLNKNTPIKVKMLRYNNNSFMKKKKLRKAIMRRSKLKNCFSKYHTYETGAIIKPNEVTV